MTKSKEPIDLDEILLEIGQFGRYQKINFFLILLPIFLNAVSNSQYIFAAGDVPYRCIVPECESNPPKFEPGEWGSWALPKDQERCLRLVPVAENCTYSSILTYETITCDEWVYENNNTIVAEFDLACQEWKRTLVGTIHSAGQICALALIAVISDTFGRRTAFILTAISPGIVGVARSYCNSYNSYLIMEFLDAVICTGAYSSGFILALETVGFNRRVLAGNIVSSTFAMGQVMMGAVAWAVPYWRTFLQVLYAPSLIFILYFFFVEESVRWLLSKGKKKEAARIIFKTAAFNNKKLSPKTIKLLSEDTEAQVNSEKTDESLELKKQLELIKEVLKSKTLMTRLFVCCFWWITVTFVYYGLSINSVSLAGNKYVNYMLISLVEIPGYCIGVMTLDRFGRRYTIMTMFFVCGMALVSLPFVPSNIIWLQITLSLVGKLCISMVFTSIYIYTTELFPTSARHRLLGTCALIGRIGNLFAPQIPLLMMYMKSLPYLLFATMAVCSSGLMLLTPETLNTKLPVTVHQAENISTVRADCNNDNK